MDGWMDGSCSCSAEKTAGEDRKKTRGRERKRGRDRDSFWPVFPRRSALGNLPKDPALRASCWAHPSLSLGKKGRRTWGIE